jgi:hypothetical protein
MKKYMVVYKDNDKGVVNVYEDDRTFKTKSGAISVSKAIQFLQ